MLKILVLLLCSSVLGGKLRCNNNTASLYLKKSTYDFSVRIADRVAQETNGHFVFSPLSSWIQLMALAEGARGRTLDEILKVTRYHRLRCFRKKFRDIVNSIEEELRDIAKWRNLIVIEKLLQVKESYKNRVEKSNAAKVMTENFNDKIKSAANVNRIIRTDMDGVITESVDADDFNMTMLLLSDTAYMKADWKSPFNPVYTSIEPFYSEEQVAMGNVNMMHQMGYFNVTDVPFINARALELPFNDRITMIVLLPTKGSATDMYFAMKDISLMTIFGLFSANGVKLVNVKMPRFKVTTDLDNIAELIDDMGIHRVFYPELADFKGISNFKIHASMMSQIADIEVTEAGVSSKIEPEYLLYPDSPTDFILNKPFAYIIADKKTNIIIFAGIYSKPSVY